MKLYVTGLSDHTTGEELRKAFERVGMVRSVNIIADLKTGRPRGFGYVEMGTEEEAAAAISQLNGHVIDGHEITVHHLSVRRTG